MTMLGFSDREPDNWDMAVGTVRGYRWWTMQVPMTAAQEITYDHLSSLRPYEIPAGIWFERRYAEPFFTHTNCWIPDVSRCTVQGMHAGLWRRGIGCDNGRYKAQCTSGGIYSGLSLTRMRGEILDPHCGCGFWAYWRGLPMDWDACLPYVRKTTSNGFQRGGYHLAIPLAGVIEGSGKTIIGERGFRCEFARITDLTFHVNTDCVVYDETRPSNIENSYMALDPSFAYPANPCNGGNFGVFAERELQIRTGVLMDTVKGIAKKILGDDIRWHSDTASLLDACPPDVNYG